MKFKQLLTKSLLAAVCLLVGQSAWAETTAFSQEFTAVGESTDPSDYGFTLSYGSGSSASLVKFSVTDGVLKCEAGPYASSSAGARTGTATATFTPISTGNIITVSYVWALGSATGNASGSYTKTRIGGPNGNALELSFYGSESNGSLKVNGEVVKSGNSGIRNTTYTVNATLDMNQQKITALTLTCSNTNFSYTAPEAINFASEVPSVDRFAFENSERQNWPNTSSIDDVNITYEESKEAVESFVVNYMYGDEVIASENIETTGLFAGDNYTVPFRMYISKSGALYKTAANNTGSYYGQTIALSKNTVVNKSLSTVDLNGGSLELLEDLDDTDGENAGIRASYQSAYNNKTYTSSVTLPSGIYTFIVRAQNKGRGSSIALGNTTVCTIDNVGNKGSWNDKTFADIQVPVGGNVTLVKGGNNTIDCYDIIIAIRTGDASVSANITSAGWATLYTPYALDFSGVEGLKAYTATTDGAKVTLTPVDNVPANTGVVLKGAANTYSIPVIASSTTEKGEMLGSATAESPATSEAPIYVLKKNSEGKAQFMLSTTGALGVGKAYLPASGTNGAKALSVIFANDPTGIANVNAAEDTLPAKRIVNGQLVIEKNGKRYNAAGAEF